jgi:hypothetical protein
MTLEDAQRLHTVEKQVAFALSKNGLKSVKGLVIRLHPNLHDLVCERAIPSLESFNPGDGLAFANFPVSRGTPHMPTPYQFVQAASLRAHTIVKDES